jgi:hypothetical protein
MIVISLHYLACMTLKADLCCTPAIKQQNRVFDLIITISLDWQELVWL